MGLGHIVIVPLISCPRISTRHDLFGTSLRALPDHALAEPINDEKAPARAGAFSVHEDSAAFNVAGPIGAAPEQFD
jgi:hypothetical protein